MRKVWYFLFALTCALAAFLIAASEGQAAKKRRKPRVVESVATKGSAPAKAQGTVRSGKKNKNEKKSGGLIDPFGGDSKLPPSTQPGGSGGSGGKFLDPFAPGAGGTVGGKSGG